MSKQVLTMHVSPSWWSTGISLEPRECLLLEDPENGRVNVSDGAVSGAVATYTCDEGFVLDGPDSRRCDNEGMWSGSQPECKGQSTEKFPPLPDGIEPTSIAVDCGPLASPADGAVDLSDGTLFDSVASYSCQDDHVLVGEANRTCTSNGSWSGEEPMCAGT